MGYRDNEFYSPFKLPLTAETLSELCAESICMSEVIIKSGRRYGGGTYRNVLDKIIANEIDVSHFSKGNMWRETAYPDDPRIPKPIHKYTSDDQILKVDPTIARTSLKKYLERNNTIPYVCAMCGNTGEWQGYPLTLELDHINGVNFDHRKENLRYLCPNCHAVTETYCGKGCTKEHKTYVNKMDIAIRESKRRNEEKKQAG